MCVKALQLCWTLWDTMDHNPPGSSLHGILQAWILEWVPWPRLGDLPRFEPASLKSPMLAGRFITTNATWETPIAYVCVCVCVCVSHWVVSDFVTPWTTAHQAPLSMELSKQKYWRGLPFHSSGNLPNPGIKLGSPGLHTGFLLSESPGKPIAWEMANNKWPSLTPNW